MRQSLRETIPRPILRWLERAQTWGPHAVRGHFNLGYCVICDRRTLFMWDGAWLRDHYFCVRCRSIPRWRAIIQVLNLYYPIWREGSIFESSPGGTGSAKLKAECPGYVPSHFWPHVALGTVSQGIRCEDLTHLTFANDSFELVITHDVFEHVFHADRAFAEVARVLRPGGAHVFTVPLYRGQRSVVRAETTTGGIQHLASPEYHADPISNQGALVVTDWGDDLVEFIRRHSGLETEIYEFRDRGLGLDGKFLEVLVTRKPRPR